MLFKTKPGAVRHHHAGGHRPVRDPRSAGPLWRLRPRAPSATGATGRLVRAARPAVGDRAVPGVDDHRAGADQPVECAHRRPTPSCIPVDTQWDAFAQGVHAAGNLGRPSSCSIITTLLIVIGQTVTSVLAAYAFAFLRFPLQAPAVRPHHRHAAAAHRGHAHHQREDVPEPRLGWHRPVTVAGRRRHGAAVPGHRRWACSWCVRGSWASPRTCATRPPSTATATCGFLWRVAVPVTRPVIGSFVLISFLPAYNQYVWPRQVVTPPATRRCSSPCGPSPARSRPAQPAVRRRLIAAIPVLILLIAFQRQLVRGLTAGAVKG